MHVDSKFLCRYNTTTVLITKLYLYSSITGESSHFRAKEAASRCEMVRIPYFLTLSFDVPYLACKGSCLVKTYSVITEDLGITHAQLFTSSLFRAQVTVYVLASLPNSL